MSSYDFVFGESKSGKSEYICRWLITEAIKHPDKKYYLFVPEQATLKAQRQIVTLSERHGMLNLDVLSFTLLYYRVVDELGIDTSEPLDEMTKTILIRKASLEAQSEGGLKVYGRVLSSRGFIANVKSFFSLIHEYNLDKEKIRLLIQNLKNIQLKNKLTDILSIYTHFNQKLKDDELIPEEINERLLKILDRSRLLKDAIVAFDGYTDFNPVQLKLMGVILKQTTHTRFGISIPGESNPYIYRKDDITDIWWLSRRLISRIIDRASMEGVTQASPGEICMQAGKRSDLKVAVLELATLREEVEALARSIRLNARINGVRYRKMAVVTDDLSAYREIIKEKFAKYEIPFFMDEKKEAIGSPWVEYLRSTLDMISGGFSYAGTMRFLKNPLVVAGCDDPLAVDIFDNELLRRGLRGRKKIQKLLEEAAIKEISDEMQGVFELEDALKNEETVVGKIRALKEFINLHELPDRMNDYLELLNSCGYGVESEDNRRFLKLTESLFEILSRVLGDENISVQDFIKLIDASLIDMSGSLIPETMDMVTVGNLRRSRLEDTDILYIVGANEGSFPKKFPSQGMFTSNELMELERVSRDFSGELGIELPADALTERVISEFYIHALIRKPKKELIVSYALNKGGSESLKPATFVEDLRGKGAITPRPTDTPVSSEDALMLFSKFIRESQENNSEKRKDETKLLYSFLKQDPGFAHIVQKLRTFAFSYDSSSSDLRLLADVSNRLYEDINEISATRLENFERCPFSYFLRFGLKLREREEFGIDPTDIGNIYHKALNLVFEKAKDKGMSVRDVPDEILERFTEIALNEVLSDTFASVGSLSAREAYIAQRVREVTRRTVRTLKFQMNQGDMENADCEMHFRFPMQNYSLIGTIDRLDAGTDEDGYTYLKVIDYKSGNTSFDINLCKNGLGMQLGLYMLAALNEFEKIKGYRGKVLPAGMFYYNIKDPQLNFRDLSKFDDIKEAGKRFKENELRMNGAVVFNDEAIKKIDKNLNIKDMDESHKLPKDSKVLKNDVSLLSREEFNEIIGFCLDRSAKDLKEILSGNINIKPYRYNRDNDKTGCAYCKFMAICRFNKDQDSFREINKEVRS